tara:strand:- start:111 stop:1742 length:1632 start_codon:yes stop_codon:yes gene_type:complete
MYDNVDHAHVRGDVIRMISDSRGDETPEWRLESMSQTVTVTLEVPKGKEECAAWLQTQSPSIVADYLGASERYYTSMAEVVFQREDAAALDLLRRENVDLKKAVQESESECIAVSKALRIEFDQRHKQALDECKASSRSMYQHEVEDVLGQLEACKSTLLNRENQEKTMLTSATKEVEERFRSRIEDHESERMRWEERNDKMTLENLNMSKEYAEKIERFARPVTPNELGIIGESMLEDCHRTLEMGTMVNVSKCREKGYADHTWMHNGAEVLIEEKYKKDLKNSDVEKFSEDVRVASVNGRIDMAIFISLRCRVTGKPIFSLEMMSGIPVLWASRDPTDPIPAEAMITTAFKIMAGLWPFLRITSKRIQVDSGNDMLHKVAAFLSAQMETHDQAQKVIRDMEGTCQKMMRNITILKKQNEKLITEVYDVRMCDARLEGASEDTLDHQVDISEELWSTPQGKELERGVADFHAHKGRYPKTIEQITTIDMSTLRILRTVRGALEEAVARRKREASRARPAKRKATTPSADDCQMTDVDGVAPR